MNKLKGMGDYDKRKPKIRKKSREVIPRPKPLIQVVNKYGSPKM